LAPPKFSTFSAVGVFGTLSGLAGDLGGYLNPLPRYAPILAFLAVGLTFAFLCISRGRAALSSGSREQIKAQASCLPCDIARFGLCAALVGATLSVLSPQKSPVLHVGQELGLVAAKVEETNTAISHVQKTAEEIKTNTSQAVGEIKTVQKQLDDIVARQTTARNQIGSMGLAFNTQSFVDAMMDGDMVAVALFLEGGMKPTDLHVGTSALIYAMQPKLSNDRVALLTLFKEHGFKLDTHLVDRRVMVNWSNGNLPPMFKSDLAPKGYTGGYYGGEFVGPAVLWISMVGCWRGFQGDDLDVIRFLARETNDKAMVLSFIEQFPHTDSTVPPKQLRSLLLDM
jgi:hypothetical protein